MNVQHLDPEKFLQAYNVDLQLLYPWEGVVEPPFGAAWAVLAPGESTKLHQHQEGETFFVMRGSGTMKVDDESTTVNPGSVVFQRPFHQHVLTNTSETEELMFLTVWWEDRQLWSQKAMTEGPEAKTEPEAPRRLMVTSAPPTPNGDLHLGHLSGPYLSADYYTRYKRLRGVDAYYACGSDDHCMYVERMGQQIGLPGPEAGARFVSAIKETLEMAGIDMHVFMDPDESAHFESLVLELFESLKSRGEIVEREGPAPYCETCDRYLFEADITGLCPHCKEGVTGNTCEACGRINDCIDIVDSRCTACDNAPVSRNYKRWIFPLSRWAEKLTEYHTNTSMNAHLRSFCERLIADGLPDVTISHVSDWGIRVPGSDPAYADQTLYVWFEMAARYLAYAEHLSENAGAEGGYGRFWRSDEAEIVQFYGFDNSFYYAVMLPAIYMAFDEELRSPTAFVLNEFYRLDGLKFSTSRGHSILGRKLLADVPRDVARFFLAYSCPEREETNFTMAEFEETVERELVRGIQPWLRGVAEKIRDECGGEVPATGDWTDEHLHFYRELEKTIAETAEAYEAKTFSPQRATRLLGELVRMARRFGRAEMHWKGVEERSQERRTGLALELVAAKVLAVLASPIMPDFSARLWSDLGYEELIGPGSWESTPTWVPAGNNLGELGADYFPSVGTKREEETSPV